jgi:hypothetical protein
MSEHTDIREIVRARYAAAATRSAGGDHEQARALESSCCGAVRVSTTDEQGQVVGARKIRVSRPLAKLI